MRWTRYDDLGTFAPLVLPWVGRDPVLGNVQGTVIGSRHAGRVPVEPGSFWAAATDGGEVVGVATRTPPHALLLSAMPPAAVPGLVDLVGEAGGAVAGVAGPTGSADAFARAWSDRHGVHAEKQMAQTVHRLDRVVPPPPVPGALVAAREQDVPLVAGWFDAFTDELGLHGEADTGASAARWVAAGELWLWVDGEPVAMAGTREAVAGIRRISAVYTVPAARRRGYAAACVAAVSAHLLATGASACMLYTDSDNPTSNGVYRRIGYRPVGDAVEWLFVPSRPRDGSTAAGGSSDLP